MVNLMSKVSIIVPVYNAEKFLAVCLDSLINQTYDDLEIIIINDGSEDDSQRIIEKYQAKYPQIRAYTTKNQGIASTRNYGVSLVTGEYFGFLDSDDYAEKTMVEKMMIEAKKNDADLVVSHFNWIYPNKVILQKEGPYQLGKEAMIHLFATLWNKLYKTDWITQTKLQFPDGNRYEDAYFLYCLVPWITKISFVDEAFVSYVQHDASITHTNNDQVKNMITVFEEIDTYYHESGWFDQYQAELEYLHIRFFLGNSFLRSVKIESKKDREETILMGWRLLNHKFPNWHKNKYLKSLGGAKNRYYGLVRSWNILLFAKLFRLIG